MKVELLKWMNGQSRWNVATYGVGIAAGLGLAIVGSALWLNFLGAGLALTNAYGFLKLRHS